MAANVKLNWKIRRKKVFPTKTSTVKVLNGFLKEEFSSIKSRIETAARAKFFNLFFCFVSNCKSTNAMKREFNAARTEQETSTKVQKKLFFRKRPEYQMGSRRFVSSVYLRNFMWLGMKRKCYFIWQFEWKQIKRAIRQFLPFNVSWSSGCEWISITERSPPFRRTDFCGLSLIHFIYLRAKLHEDWIY